MLKLTMQDKIEQKQGLVQWLHSFSTKIALDDWSDLLMI